MPKRKNRGGRPPKYNKKFAEEIIEFFDVPYLKQQPLEYPVKKDKDGNILSKFKLVANDLPLIQQFAHSINVDSDTIANWANATTPSGRIKYKEFLGAYRRAKKMQEAMWASNSLQNLYSPQFTMFFGKNIFHWKDKQDVDVTSQGKEISGFNYLPPAKPQNEHDNPDD